MLAAFGTAQKTCHQTPHSIPKSAAGSATEDAVGLTRQSLWHSLERACCTVWWCQTGAAPKGPTINTSSRAWETMELTPQGMWLCSSASNRRLVFSHGKATASCH